MLKLISKSAHPWWEADYKGTVGFVPFNYVLVTSKSESGGGSNTGTSRGESSNDTHSCDEGSNVDSFVDDSQLSDDSTLRVTLSEKEQKSPTLNLEEVSAVSTSGTGPLVSPTVERTPIKTKPIVQRVEVKNPLWDGERARNASDIAPRAQVKDEETPIPEGQKNYFKDRRSRSSIGPINPTNPSSPNKDGLKRSFNRPRSSSTSIETGMSSGETSPKSPSVSISLLLFFSFLVLFLSLLGSCKSVSLPSK
jgi:hypothetical protein